MSDKIVKNWLSLAEYDFESAKVLFKGKRYLTMAFLPAVRGKNIKSFLCQGKK
jgi:hypothetical protein